MRFLPIGLALTLYFCVSTLRGTTVSDLGEQEQLLFKETAGDLRCPTCSGLSVLESDAPFSEQIKDLVKEQVKLGKDKKEIVDFFVKRYGPWILREPPKKGFSALAWLIPIVLLCGGPLMVWLVVFRQKKTFETFGVRSTEEIILEMQGCLKDLSNARKQT